jgi:hypothetical protein
MTAAIRYVNGQQELPRAPGYSIGTECAHISDEVDPKTQKVAYNRTAVQHRDRLHADKQVDSQR